MEEISKKELLNETGISYGQLYRWKRGGLIPEEWFIKRSAFTGQETFFPRDRMLARVKAILALKDTHSLDEIREGLVSESTVFKTREALLDMSEMDCDFVERLQAPEKITELNRESLAAVIGLYEMAARKGIEKDEIAKLIDEALTTVAECTCPPTIMTLVDVGGTWHFITAAQAVWVAVDRGITFVDTVQVADVVERIRARKAEL